MANGQTRLGDGIPNFDRIVRAIESGRCIPFLGAGVSMDFKSWVNGQDLIPGCPSGEQLKFKLTDAIKRARLPETQLNTLAQLPDLPSVAEFFHFVDNGQRSDLESVVKQAIASAVFPRPIHWVMTGIPSIRCVFTTNYDELIETAAKNHPTPRDLRGPFVYNQSLPEQIKPSDIPIELIKGERFNPDLPAPAAGHPLVLYKMHGCVKHSDSMLITTNDYVQYIALWRDERRGMPKEFRDLLYKNTFLFLGYGLSDWNFRVIWESMITSFPNGKFEINSYAIKKNVSEFESEIYKRRGIDLIDCDLTYLARALAEVFDIEIPLPPHQDASVAGNGEGVGL